MEQLDCSIALLLKPISAQSDHLKKQFFSIFLSVFALVENNREYIRELTRAVAVDFFSPSRHYVTDVGFGANLKNAFFLYLGLNTHAHN